MRQPGVHSARADDWPGRGRADHRPRRDSRRRRHHWRNRLRPHHHAAHLRGAATFEPGSEALGTNDPLGADISGQLLGSFYAAEKLVEGIHTLVLEDGREFDFRVLQPETNEIVGVSWFRSPSRRDTQPTRVASRRGTLYFNGARPLARTTLPGRMLEP